MARFPDRMSREFETIAAIVDEALCCHVGVLTDEGPLVVPTIHARIGQKVYVHGSVLARWMQSARDANGCLTVTLLDDLVLARSAFNHSMNYRSVVACGQMMHVTSYDEKLAAVGAIVERICRGRWDDVRRPTDGELRTTMVLSLALDEAVAKVRVGPPIDFEADLDSDVWAGQVPIRVVRGVPIRDPILKSTIRTPSYLGLLQPIRL